MLTDTKHECTIVFAFFTIEAFALSENMVHCGAPQIHWIINVNSLNCHFGAYTVPGVPHFQTHLPISEKMNQTISQPRCCLHPIQGLNVWYILSIHSCLVVYLWKLWVSWDDEIPNWMDKYSKKWSKAPTRFPSTLRKYKPFTRELSKKGMGCFEKIEFNGLD